MANIYPLETRRKHFININNIKLVQLIDKQYIKATQHSVLSTMAGFAHDDGAYIYPAIKLIAKITKLSERTITRKIKSLLEVGFLIKVRETDNMRPNEYSLNLPLIEKCHYPTRDKKLSTAPLVELSTGTPKSYPQAVKTHETRGFQWGGVVTTLHQGVVTECHPNKELLINKIRTTTTNAHEVLDNSPQETVPTKLAIVEQVTLESNTSLVNTIEVEDCLRARSVEESMVPSVVSSFLEKDGQEAAMRAVRNLKGKITLDQASGFIQTYGVTKTESGVAYVKKMDLAKFYNLGGYLNKVILEGYADKKTSPISQNRPSSGIDSPMGGSAFNYQDSSPNSYSNDIEELRERSHWTLEENRKWYLGLTQEARSNVMAGVVRKWPMVEMLCQHQGCELLSNELALCNLFKGVADVINEIRFEIMAADLRSKI